jgi:hypothetical protein
MSNPYKCQCCGIQYDEIPLCFGTEYPNFYHSIPTDERESRVEFTKSLCIIDEEHFFHRGRLVIPITDYEEELVFDVWTTISERN